MVDDFAAVERDGRTGGVEAGAMSPRWIIHGARMTKLAKVPNAHAAGGADTHEAADAGHSGVEAEAEAELADVGAKDLGDQSVDLGGEDVIVVVEALAQMPRLGETEEFAEAQRFELARTLQAVAHQELEKTGAGGGVGEDLGADHAGVGMALVKRVEHNAGGPAFGKRRLLFVEETAFQREGDEHPDN